MKIKTNLKIGETNLPPGNFADSCTDIKYDETTGALSAKCKDIMGNLCPSGIMWQPGPGKYIQNCDGVLHDRGDCSPIPPYWMPRNGCVRPNGEVININPK